MTDGTYLLMGGPLDGQRIPRDLDRGVSFASAEERAAMDAEGYYTYSGRNSYGQSVLEWVAPTGREP